MRLSAFLLVTLFCFVSFPAHSEGFVDMLSHGEFKAGALDKSDVKKWNKARRSGGVLEGELVKDILTLQDQGKILASLDWLRDIIKDGETDYMYPFIYSRQLHRTQFVSNSGQAKATARAMIYYANLLLMTDAARCDDNGVGTNRMFSLNKGLTPVTQETNSLPDNIKLISMSTALRLEEKHKDREKQPEICKGGAKFMVRAMGNPPKFSWGME